MGRRTALNAKKVNVLDTSEHPNDGGQVEREPRSDADRPVVDTTRNPKCPTLLSHEYVTRTCSAHSLVLRELSSLSRTLMLLLSSSLCHRCKVPMDRPWQTLTTK